MVEAVIFDWAGTTVDYGCFAPVQAFADVFEHHGVKPTMEETRAPMGMLKIDHIREMLRMERIASAWERVHGKRPDEDDAQALYALFPASPSRSPTCWTRWPSCAPRACASAPPPATPTR